MRRPPKVSPHAVPSTPKRRPTFSRAHLGRGAHSVIVSSQLRVPAATVAIALSSRLSRSRRRCTSCPPARRSPATLIRWASLQRAPRQASGCPTRQCRRRPRLTRQAIWATSRCRRPDTNGSSTLPRGPRTGRRRRLSSLATHCGSLILPALPAARPRAPLKEEDCQLRRCRPHAAGAAGYDGMVHYRIDPASIAVVYGGFAVK